MTKILAFLSDLFALIFALPGALARLLNPPPAPDPYDDAAEMIRSAERKLEAEADEPTEPVASIVRRFLAGEQDAPVFMLPLRQQRFVVGLERSGVDVSSITDADLEAHVTGRAAAEGWRPLFYPGDRAAPNAEPAWNPAPARAFGR